MKSRGLSVSKILILQIGMAALVQAFACRAHAVTVTVPGTANPWLSGMPNGTMSEDGYDIAPAESPILVGGIPIGGVTFTFSATGIVSHGNFDPQGHGPEGIVDSTTSHNSDAENGIANVYAPCDALLGVFLDNNAPTLMSPPVPYAFETSADRDFLTIEPALQETFFIGDGQTSQGVIQQFTAPAGATRLFLEVMDSAQWSNNTGSFSVNVTVPEPASLPLLAAGATVLVLRLVWRRCGVVGA
jgi:hypothetical protein